MDAEVAIFLRSIRREVSRTERTRGGGDRMPSVPNLGPFDKEIDEPAFTGCLVASKLIGVIEECISHKRHKNQ